MPNEFQQVVGSLLKNIPFTNCFIDDTLIASKSSLDEHQDILLKILNILEKNMAVKWEACAFFQKKYRMVVGFQDFEHWSKKIG